MVGRILGDKVITSTDLNRKTGKYLRQAARSPVTVKMKDADLVILNREDAARVCEEAAQLAQMMGLAEYLLSKYGGGRRTALADDFSWLDVLDRDELSEFIEEYGDMLRKVIRGSAAVSDLGDLLHEWYASALALNDPELVDAARRLNKE